MATVVTGEWYIQIDGKMHEIKRQLRQNSGYPYDLVGLNCALQAIVEGRFNLAFPSAAIAAEYGYTVVEDVALTLKSVGDLELVPFLEPDDNGRVNGETMRDRAKAKKANLGLADLKVALDDQTKISAEARPYCIVFSGTLLRDPHGDLYVAYLYWRGDRWLVFFDGVASGWGDDDRLARSK